MAEEQKRTKRLKAAALQYRHNIDKAPRMTAVGDGYIAEQIIKLAEENGVPITRDPDLVAILANSAVGSTVNPRLYDIVAELMVFIYRLKERWQEVVPDQYNVDSKQDASEVGNLHVEQK
jgi:flagellar biosynthesis protein